MHWQALTVLPSVKLTFDNEKNILTKIYIIIIIIIEKGSLDWI